MSPRKRNRRRAQHRRGYWAPQYVRGVFICHLWTRWRRRKPKEPIGFVFSMENTRRASAPPPIDTSNMDAFDRWMWDGGAP